LYAGGGGSHRCGHMSHAGGAGGGGGGRGGNGAPNTGGGGGGSRASTNVRRGEGGSGIVIVRYLTSDNDALHKTKICLGRTCAEEDDLQELLRLKHSISSNKKLCVGDTCLSEADIRDLLQMKREVVKYSDDVVISADSNHGKYGGNTSNCGWYGCRVADMGSDRKMTFGHGRANPRKFWFRKHPSNL